MADSEFYSVTRALQSGDLFEIIGLAQQIRSEMGTRRAWKSDFEIEFREQSISPTWRLVIDQVESLLRSEARLSVADAINGLATELGNPTIAYGKRSFSAELEAILRQHSAPEVLSAAQRVRNRAVSSGKQDWPLSDK
jgi:hypothetical protein